MSWKDVDWGRGVQVERIVAMYDVTDLRIPGTKYRVKILEGASVGYFLAVPNVCWKLDDAPDWLAATGGSEDEALGNLLALFSEELTERGELDDDDVEWADPRDF